MVSTYNIALSGLNVAGKRLEVSANNLANQFSTSRLENGQVINEPYLAQRVEASSNPIGGVQARVVDRTPATTIVFDPTASNADANGASQVPAVDTAEELIGTIIATYDFRANLKVIQAQNKLDQETLNIIS